jgi:hypothetical protein
VPDAFARVDHLDRAVLGVGRLPEVVRAVVLDGVRRLELGAVDGLPVDDGAGDIGRLGDEAHAGRPRVVQVDARGTLLDVGVDLALEHVHGRAVGDDRARAAARGGVGSPAVGAGLAAGDGDDRLGVVRHVNGDLLLPAVVLLVVAEHVGLVARLVREHPRAELLRVDGEAAGRQRRLQRPR